MAAQWSCCKRNAADAEQSFFFLSLCRFCLSLVSFFFFFNRVVSTEPLNQLIFLFSLLLRTQLVVLFFSLSLGSSKLSQSGGAQGRLQTVARTLIDSICGTNFSFYQLDHSFRFVVVLLLVYTVLILFIFWIYGRRFFFFLMYVCVLLVRIVLICTYIYIYTLCFFREPLFLFYVKNSHRALTLEEH